MFLDLSECLGGAVDVCVAHCKNTNSMNLH